MTFQTSPLDAYASAIQVWLNDGKTNEEIVALLKKEFDVDTSETSVRRAIQRHNLVRPERTEQPKMETPGLKIEGDDATIISDLTTEQLGEAEDMIRARGLDPEEWILERVVINEWEGFYKKKDFYNQNDPRFYDTDHEVVKQRQFKLFLKRRVALKFVSPAVEVERLDLPQPRPVLSSNEREYELVVVVGDEQEPYSDPELKQLFIDWLKCNQPDRGVHLGDLMDFPTISRHKDNPEWAATVQECLNAGYKTLKSYVLASPSTSWELLVGNHDERLRNELLLRAERMYGIKPADDGTDQDEVLSVKNLLHLDDLGVKFIDPKGGYSHATTKVAPALSVRHGWLTGNNTADRSLDRIGHSIIVGHTHNQKITYKCVYDVDGKPHTLQAVEAGTMCKIMGGVGFAVNPNWHNGFATATVWPDGSFNIELATFTNGTLKWRDQRYQIRYEV